LPCKGCAGRMRKLLERDGYVYDDESKDWTAPDGRKVKDEDVELHHSREAAKLLVEKLRRYV